VSIERCGVVVELNIFVFCIYTTKESTSSNTGEMSSKACLESCLFIEEM